MSRVSELKLERRGAGPPIRRPLQFKTEGASSLTSVPEAKTESREQLREIF